MSDENATATMASGGDEAAAAAAPVAAPAQQRAPLLVRAYDVVERVEKPGELGKREVSWFFRANGRRRRRR